MIRSIRAELVKLTQARFVLVTSLVTAVVAAGGTAISVLTAFDGPPGSSGGPDQSLSIESLADAGGGTAPFAQTAAFAGTFLLAVFIAAVAGEFSRGTFRTMLLQQPGRVRVLVGKMVAVVGFTAVVGAGAEVLSWVTARLIAPSQGIDTARWSSADALGAGLQDFGRLTAFVAGYAVLATMVGVLARSIPVGVGVALVWAGPFENIVAESWEPGQDWFPGLLLRSIISPATTTTSTSRAVLTLAVYGIVAIAVAGVALARRDVTS